MCGNSNTRKPAHTKFLHDEMADFIELRDDVAPDELLFAVTKHFLAHEMERGCKASAVKRNRIHDIRHSHVSLLIEMDFYALAIVERMSHEAVDITYRYAHLFPMKQDDMTAALDGVGDKQDSRENSACKRSKTMAFRCTLEEHKLICEMAAWSGMSRQDYIIAKLTDTQVEVIPSVSVQKALRDSIAELTKEVHLASSYGELSESLRQRVELVMGFFLALGESFDAPAEEEPQTRTPSAVPKTPEAGADDDTGISGMGRG